MEIKQGLEANFYGVDGNCFKLDTFVFEAVEDPEDGYRSCMSEVRMADSTEGLIFFQTPLARIRVTDQVDRHSDFDGYALVDIEDGHVWLSFGTEDVGDYYPSFTFYYSPKAAASTA